MHRIVKAETARKIVGIKTVTHENSGCDITSESALANDIHGFVFIKLTDTLTKLIHGDVDKSVHMTSAVLHRGASIKKCDILIILQALGIFIVPLLNNTVFDIPIMSEPYHLRSALHL